MSIISHPKISIVTVCYNSAKTIERTIKSVLDQNYDNLEYILIDGASKDETMKIVEKYKSKLAIVISEKDNGISDAFNKGACMATGEIVGILNSDDWHEPNTLSTVASLLKNGGADFLVGALRYWNGNNGSFVIYPDQHYENKILYKMPNLNHPATFFKNVVYHNIGYFDLKYKYAMDYDFFLRVYQAGYRGVFTDQILSNMSSNGASDINAIKTYKEVMEIATDKKRAVIYFYISAIKYYVRSFLTICKLDELLLKIRKIKYKN